MQNDRSERLGSRDVLEALSDYLAARSVLRRQIRVATELSDSAWNALLELRAAAEKGQTMTPKELAAALELRSASITALVDKLVRLGYVDRTASTVDRRGLALSITEAGTAFVDRHDRARAPESAVASTLGDGEARLIVSVFAELTEAADRSFPASA
jgi:DNA-binding MarR family transcriptional regulator